MAAILRDSTVVVAVVRTRPRAIPLSMINHEKIHTWVSFSYMVMGLRLAALRAAGAPLLLVTRLQSSYTDALSTNNMRRKTSHNIFTLQVDTNEIYATL